MMQYTAVVNKNLNSLESLIYHFASPRRVALHLLSVVAKAILTPLIHLVLGVAIKRLLGLNTACPAENDTQLTHLRRYINSVLLSQEALYKAFLILGNHSEIVSVSRVSWIRMSTPIHCINRLYIEPWEPRLVEEYIGPALESIAWIQNY